MRKGWVSQSNTHYERGGRVPSWRAPLRTYDGGKYFVFNLRNRRANGLDFPTVPPQTQTKKTYSRYGIWKRNSHVLNKIPSSSSKYVSLEAFVTLQIVIERAIFGINKSHQQSLITTVRQLCLTFRRRIKSRLPFPGIIRRLPYSTRFQDKG